jgi:hypothetical protein
MADYRQLAGALTNSDTIQATPRNPVLGGVADLLGMAYKLPEMPRMGVPGIDFLAANRKKVMDLLGMGDVQKTADALSYGNAVGTGKGMTYRPKDETIGAALTVAPVVAPAARMVGKGAMETGRFVAPKAGQLAEQYMVNTGGILPLDVYHGTPHTLPPTPRNPLGEFDASKIGTGEGAQAYGHGIYVAEARPVAEEYVSKLSKPIVDFTNTQPSNELEKALKKQYEELAGRTQASGRAQAVYDLWTQHANPVGDFLYGNSYMNIPPMNPEKLARRLEIRDAAKKLGPPISSDSGNLYKVDLPDEKIAKMLDYDKHLSEQSKAVQDILLPYQKEIGGSFGTGEQTLKAIAFERRMKGLDDSPAAVAQQLKEMGIPGVQYLDEGSRNLANTYIVRHPQGGENVFSSKAEAEAFLKKYPKDNLKLIEPKVTRNFVVFPGEEKSMTILERNGQKK